MDNVLAGSKVAIVAEGVVVILLAIAMVVAVVTAGLAKQAHKSRPEPWRRR